MKIQGKSTKEYTSCNANFNEGKEMDNKVEMERQRRRENMQKKRSDPEYRQQERARNSAARKRAREDPDFRERERARNSAARRRAREDPEYRERERARDTAAHRRRREDPDFRQRERARESEARRLRRQKSRRPATEETVFLPTSIKEEAQETAAQKRSRKMVDLNGFMEVCLSEETTLTFC